MIQEQAPLELLQNYSCNCKNSKCYVNQHSCVGNGVSCIELCSCVVYKNGSETVIEIELLNDVSHDDDSDDNQFVAS